MIKFFYFLKCKVNIGMLDRINLLLKNFIIKAILLFSLCLILITEAQASIWNTFRIPLDDYDDRLGFFLSNREGNTVLWWDTGIIINGSGLGLRYLLNANNFIGGY